MLSGSDEMETCIYRYYCLLRVLLFYLRMLLL